MIYKQYILEIYDTRDKENETPVIKQNLGNWYSDYFRCFLVTEILSHRPKMSIMSFLILDHLCISNM